ncbi:MAG TPA: DUF4907 domain-containing protein [Bacteroidia bacterium]|nr:DUF4907 domain-containing protein [Bacteroidia bacterium]
MSIRLFSLLLFTAILTSCHSNTEENTTESKAPQPSVYNPYSKSTITLELFRVDSVDNTGVRGWGYNVMVDGKIVIHQPTVPAVMGNNGFSSEEKAKKAGEFVIYKIKNNILPPAVTPEELDSLDVLD